MAAFFGKEHRSVLASIDKLIEQAKDFGAHSFMPTSYLDESNRQSRCFDMDRDGFTLLAMGFTGAKALQFKIPRLHPSTPTLAT